MLSPEELSQKINEDSEDWIKVCKSAIFAAENRIREQEGQNRLTVGTAVYLPNDGFRLLTLKVWTMRYHIDLEFIFYTLMKYYARHRKSNYMRARRRQGKNRFKGSINLGIPLGVLCGDASRQIIEDAVTTAYPDGENERAAKEQTKQKLLQIEPPELSYKSLPDMVSQYHKIMTERQKKTTEDKSRSFTRPWRGNPWR